VKRAGAIAALSAALFASGCGDAQAHDASAPTRSDARAPTLPDARAPTLPRAALVLEPPRIGVGEVATLEIAVAAPPGHALRPLALPEAPAGIEVLGVDALPVERQSSRWLHRTRVRVRAREVGALTWPGGVVEIEAPDGSLATLALEALALEVGSVAPEFPERSLPFGVRRPADEEASDRGALEGAAVGAVLALLGVAAVRVLRRRSAGRAAPAPPPEATPAPPPPWEEARAALSRARALASADPFDASDLAALALRRYAERRFAIDAPARTGAGFPISLLACTSEELAASPAPFAATTRWPILISALRALDAHRFRPRDTPEARAALERALADALTAAERFVAETLPPGEAG